MTRDDPTLAAQVVLRPASGAAPPAEQLTAATLRRYEPSAHAAATAQAYFRETGFDVGDLVGISFSVTGPRSRFEAVFGDTITVDDAGPGAAGVMVAGGGRELRLDLLPGDVAAAVQAVTFTPPPEFGPTGFR